MTVVYRTRLALSISRRTRPYFLSVDVCLCVCVKGEYVYAYTNRYYICTRKGGFKKKVAVHCFHEGNRRGPSIPPRGHIVPPMVCTRGPGAPASAFRPRPRARSLPVASLSSTPPISRRPRRMRGAKPSRSPIAYRARRRRSAAADCPRGRRSRRPPCADQALPRCAPNPIAA